MIRCLTYFNAVILSFWNCCLISVDSDAFKGIKNLLSTSDEEKEFVDPYALVSFAGKSVSC